jgi:hypothetical protein
MIDVALSLMALIASGVIIEAFIPCPRPLAQEEAIRLRGDLGFPEEELEVCNPS